jgi:hypothetical protein
MGQTTDQIENHIETTRDDLKSNFEELETRVKSVTDWRRYFREHPGAMLAVAFGGGVLLSTLTRRAGSNPGGAPYEGVRTTSGAKHEVHRTFDSITSALVGAAAAKFKGVLGQVVPGFSDHLARSEGERDRERDRDRDLTH